MLDLRLVSSAGFAPGRDTPSTAGGELGLGPGRELQRPAAGGIDLERGGKHPGVPGQGDPDRLIEGERLLPGGMGGTRQQGRQDDECREAAAGRRQCFVAAKCRRIVIKIEIFSSVLLRIEFKKGGGR